MTTQAKRPDPVEAMLGMTTGETSRPHPARPLPARPQPRKAPSRRDPNKPVSFQFYMPDEVREAIHLAARLDGNRHDLASQSTSEWLLDKVVDMPEVRDALKAVMGMRGERLSAPLEDLIALREEAGRPLWKDGGRA